METNVADKITEKVRVLSAEQKEQVLDFVKSLAPEKRTPWQLWKERLKDIPEEELEMVPTDASSNLDHHLYGVPKK